MGLYTWDELKYFVEHCNRCDLCRERRNPVMGRGDLNSRIMLIAEAPGRMEDEKGIPFVGRSGEILDELLKSVSLSRDEIYITNINKCHPPGNRDPEEAEQQACMPFLKYETALIRPKIMVCLGRIAAEKSDCHGLSNQSGARYLDRRKGFFSDGCIPSFCSASGPFLR